MNKDDIQLFHFDMEIFINVFAIYITLYIMLNCEVDVEKIYEVILKYM
jgi:hypothetical protein